MGFYGDFNSKKNKKKPSKEEQARKAAKGGQPSFGGYQFTQPEVISRAKKKDTF